MGKPNQRSASLKSGRPPVLSKIRSRPALGSSSKQSSKATRSLIQTHHNLHKSRSKALANGDQHLVAELDAQIEHLGGLDAYQNASLVGQSRDRGGDSSSLLVSWLQEEGLIDKAAAEAQSALRVLEIGALSSRNAISSLIGKGIEYVKRIDLKSQEPEFIEEADFMNFAVPAADHEKFDVISLSLVLNYVPHPEGRGDMLKRTRLFLRGNEYKSTSRPCLFLVLPLPCLTNSRYMTNDRLRELMSTLGYVSIRVHQSAKLHYELFHLSLDRSTAAAFKKAEVNPGKGRNNFCVTLTDT